MPAEDHTKFSIWDYVVVAVYLCFVLMYGIFHSVKNRGSVGGYFLAGWTSPGFVVGCSIFATNIGTGHFIGLAGTAAKQGLAVGVFEITAVYPLVMLGWLFLPVYKASGIFTLPEYMSKRFGGVRIRFYLAVMSLFLYIFTKISADLYSGAIYMNQAVYSSDSIYIWVTFLVIISALFNIAGGMTAIMWTDFIQAIFMVIGSFVLMVRAFYEVGGYEEMKRKYPMSLADTTIQNSGNASYPYRLCGRPKKDWFTFLLSSDDEDLPWTGVMFGLTVSGVWYFCTDQVIVQRALAAKNITHGKMGCLVAAYMKLIIPWLIVMPGLISRILYPNEIACNERETCETICMKTGGCTDIAYPLLTVRLLPDGLRGMMLAVMMSAIISSLTSVFSSITTIFTIDVWYRMRENASDMELMVVGRMSVVVLIGISILWLPVVKEAGTLFSYIQEMTSFLGAPVCSAFVLAVFWNRTTEAGVFWGLIVGTCSGLVRGIWQTAIKATPACGETLTEQPAIRKINYLHFGALNFLLTTTVITLISFLTPAPAPDDYLGKTYFTRFCLSAEEEAKAKATETSPELVKKIKGSKMFEDLPWYYRWLLWICGVETMISPAKDLATAEMNRCIFEEARMATILQISMVVALIVTTGFLIFFSL